MEISRPDLKNHTSENHKDVKTAYSEKVLHFIFLNITISKNGLVSRRFQSIFCRPDTFLYAYENNYKNMHVYCLIKASILHISKRPNLVFKPKTRDFARFPQKANENNILSCCFTLRFEPF